MPGVATSISNLKMVLRELSSAEPQHCNSKFDWLQKLRGWALSNIFKPLFAYGMAGAHP
jgi:hypothetical protein